MSKENSNSIPHVFPHQLEAMLMHHFKSMEPICVLSPPGLGKSRIVWKVCKKLWGIEPHLYVGSVRQPTDLMGWPVPNMATREMEWLPPGKKDLPREAPGCIFADEITAAPPMVQSALLQLMGDEKRTGSYYLPDGVARVAAGNRAEDRTAAGRLITALADRMTVVELKASLDDWAKWANNGGNIHPGIVAYIRFRETQNNPCLHDWDAARTHNATPRGWERVSRLLPGCPEEVKEATVGGIVGAEHAAQLLDFLKNWQDMPSLEEILNDPKHAKLPGTSGKNDLAMAFATISGLAARTNSKTAQAIMIYANRLPPELQLVLVKDAQSVDPGISNTPEFKQWLKSQQDLLEGGAA